MMNDPTKEITEILSEIERGEESAAARLMPMIYEKLHALAARYFKQQKPEHTLQPTALVHEAFMKLVGSATSDWKSQAHFFSVAARAMRQILTDHARRKKAAKRGGHPQRVTLSGLGTPASNEIQIDLISLDQAMNKLAELSPRQCRIVEMRFLAGMEMEDIAKVLDLATRTVYREWRAARAFLQCELSGDSLT
jgi:RNA polymerase sigma factor (TIGR02999 family)